MTAAAILDSCSPPVADDFLVELLTKHHVTVEQALGIKRLYEAWGDEPARGRGQAELRPEIRGRVLAFLAGARGAAVTPIPAPEYLCHACGAGMRSVFYMDARGNEICKGCYDARPMTCEHCPAPLPPGDRVPTEAGGFAHATCALRVANAFQNQRAHLLGGAGLVSLKGGRS